MSDHNSKLKDGCHERFIHREPGTIGYYEPDEKVRLTLSGGLLIVSFLASAVASMILLVQLSKVWKLRRDQAQWFEIRNLRFPVK
jgi:hypothetical protein